LVNKGSFHIRKDVLLRKNKILAIYFLIVLSGIEAMYMVKKGQIHQQQVKSVQIQVEFIQELFGLVA
jgi:hypothetical protein